MKPRVSWLLLLSALAWFANIAPAATQGDLDSRVRRFLDENRGRWHDLNVPAVDGQTLHDIIVQHKYKRALEIGTSTGHSGIWIAWALSKTGGKLITIDIDEERHRQAMKNFEAAGLSRYVDARLGDAHDIVPSLQGPFDFVFSDADKDWYTNYLKAVLPKLQAGAARPILTGSRSCAAAAAGGGDMSTRLPISLLPSFWQRSENRRPPR